MDADQLIAILSGPDGGRVAAAIADALARRCQAQGVSRSQSRSLQSREETERAVRREVSLETAKSRGETAARFGLSITDHPYCDVDHRNAWVDGYEERTPERQASA